MSLEIAILGFLAEHPRSGYDLKTRCFSGPIAGFWNADQAQIYRTLDRLERERLVSVRRTRQEGRPDRKLFEITPAGSELLGVALSSPPPPPPQRDAFLVQLYFAHRLGDEELGHVLRARRDEHQALLDELEGHSDALAHDMTLTARDALLRQTALDGAVARQRASIDWLDDCIGAVEAGALPGGQEASKDRVHVFGG